ncbi:head decoration protein [Paraburkholderia aspalathi]|nr:head decoration protein [Paraburkholderia aspalathi]
MTVFKEPRHAGEFILTEASGHRSREGITIAENQAFEAGTVLALLAQTGGVTTTAKATAGNTGNGALTFGDPSVNSKVKNGVYRATATAETTFSVEDPNGVNIGNATVGAAFNKEVKFTIAAGAAAFVAGDTFEVTVGVESPGDYHAVAHDPDGEDGSEKASAIAIYPAKTGTGQTSKIAAIFRDAEVNGECVAWAEGITADEKASAVADLASAGIIVR